MSATPVPEGTFEAFRNRLHKTLTHLHDPDHAPSPLLYLVTGCAQEDGAGPVQSAVIRAIQDLRPSEGTPTMSATGRVYDVLFHRFILRLTQEETADRLSHSVRNLNRLQREAVHLLARRMWEHREAGLGSGRIDVVRAGRPGAVHPRAPDWREHLREEVAVLERHSPETKFHLSAALEGALRIARAAAMGYRISCERAPELSGVEIALHPSILRQALLSATAQIAHSVSSGDIEWRVEATQDQVPIWVIGRPGAVGAAVDVSVLSELLKAYGGTARSGSSGDDVWVLLALPRATTARNTATVLVIDDNVDLATLFKTYCMGTRYEITHIARGSDALETAATTQPGVILLDVMLPDMDGWDVLLDLRAHPDTRSIPVIVCSVIADEPLALALGARCYLRKPVWREQLIDALDLTLSRKRGDAPADPGNTPSGH